MPSQSTFLYTSLVIVIALSTFGMYQYTNSSMPTYTLSAITPLLALYAVLSVFIIRNRNANDQKGQSSKDLTHASVKLAPESDLLLSVKILSHDILTGELICKTSFGSIFIGNESQVVRA